MYSKRSRALVFDHFIRSLFPATGFGASSCQVSVCHLLSARFFFGTAGGGIADGFDHKRRFHVGLDLFEFGQQLPVLGGRSQLQLIRCSAPWELTYFISHRFLFSKGLDALKSRSFCSFFSSFSSFDLLPAAFSRLQNGALGKIEAGRSSVIFSSRRRCYLVEEAEIFSGRWRISSQRPRFGRASP